MKTYELPKRLYDITIERHAMWSPYSVEEIKKMGVPDDISGLFPFDKQPEGRTFWVFLHLKDLTATQRYLKREYLEMRMMADEIVKGMKQLLEGIVTENDEKLSTILDAIRGYTGDDPHNTLNSLAATVLAVEHIINKHPDILDPHLVKMSKELNHKAMIDATRDCIYSHRSMYGRDWSEKLAEEYNKAFEAKSWDDVTDTTKSREPDTSTVSNDYVFIGSLLKLQASDPSEAFEVVMNLFSEYNMDYDNARVQSIMESVVEKNKEKLKELLTVTFGESVLTRRI